MASLRRSALLGSPLLAAGIALAGIAPWAAAAPVAHASSPGQANAAGMKIASTVTLDKAIATMVPASISSTGKLTIGAQLQQPPDDYYASNGTTAIGFEVDLAAALGKELGLKIVYAPMAFDSLITSLQDGRVDITMSAMNDTKPREKTINFVDYLVDGIGILVKAGNPDHVTSPMDLCGKSVTVVSGTTQQAYATQLSGQCTKAGKQGVTTVISSSTAQEDESLLTGRVAAVLNDNITDAYDQEVDPKLFESVEYKPIEPGPYGIGVNKSQPKLLAAIHVGLQRLMNDGVYGKILAAWNLSSVELKYATINHGIPG